MIPKRETPEAIEERGTEYPLKSSRAIGKRKVFEVLALVLIALMVTIGAFYEAKSVLGTPIWGGFCALIVFIGVWLIVGILRAIRKR